MEISTRPGRRILALYLPRLSTDRLQRKQKACGAPAEQPLVVADKLANALRLVAVDLAAARLGLKPGMALADARARIPALAVATADPRADLRLLEDIADACERYTPLVALDPPQALFLDVTGVAHLFGGEAKMMETARHRLTRQGFTVRAALAGNADAARALAKFADGAIVRPGDEAQAIAALPVDALGADDTIIHALKRAGLKTIGQVVERGRGELRARFGSEFIFTLDCLTGRAERPIKPRSFLPDVMAEQGFADPVVSE
ncbi:MAG TPA: DNA polymerase Y family protein, partial [Micropepsaceae bacterium]|nr:DNA polymerase Y family protein [Micropepsaceae bacterium]